MLPHHSSTGLVRRAAPRVAAGLLLALLAGCSSGDGGTAGSAAPTTAASATASSSSAAVDGCGAPAAVAATDPDAAAAVLAATQAFLGTLDATQRTAVQAERTQANLSLWSNLPDQLFKRAGLRMDKLSAAQRAAVQQVLRAALSDEGYRQVTQISTADGILTAQGGTNLDFGAEHYWIRLVGAPAATGKWTIQYGGHHLAVNITVAGAAMTLAPTLWGAQPASYTSGGTSAEPLCGETRKAFALIGALDATQQRAAILTAPVKEIVLGAGQDGKTLAAEGVKASTFTGAQQQLLLALIDEWITPLNPGQAAAKLAAVAKDLGSVTFAWYGATTIGRPVYYRVQGPAFVIEFAHQQGQGANAGGVTHIHAIYREPGNDYGAGLS